MATRAEFLNQVWTQIISANMDERWIDAAMASSERTPDAPFADLGPALRRPLAASAVRRDLCLLARHASYEAIFQLLYKLDTPASNATTTRCFMRNYSEQIQVGARATPTRPRGVRTSRPGESLGPSRPRFARNLVRTLLVDRLLSCRPGGEGRVIRFSGRVPLIHFAAGS